MINGATNLHILHRANTQRSDFDADDGSSTGDNDARRHESEALPGLDYHPLSPLLPLGLEYELSPSETEEGDSQDQEECNGEEEGAVPMYSRECNLSFLFVILVFSGVGNILAAKMQAVSMYNYPVFLSLLSYVIYVPICFAFIIPVSRYGWLNGAIPPSHMALPKRPFAVMGLLDCLAAVMQCFASIYLPGSLLVLLPQASIPLSMLLSRHMVGERYRKEQYLGSAVVLVGLLLVLEPVVTYRHAPDYLCEAIDLPHHCTACSVVTTEEACVELEPDNHELFLSPTGRNASLALLLNPAVKQSARILLENADRSDAEPPNDKICQWVPLSEATTGKDLSVFIWSIVMVLSCIPMTLSSVYKQIKLRAHGDLQPVFLIGWIGVFQLLFTVISAPSLALATGIPIGKLPENVWDGLKCYVGVGSVDLGCHPDSSCASGHAFWFVNLCLLFQAMYMLSTMLILKYGSTSLLYLALTLMIPLGNLTFSLPFIRTDSSIYISDLVALLVIVVGLSLYRFGHKLPRRRRVSETFTDGEVEQQEEEEEESQSEPCHSLLEPLISYAYV